MNKYYLLTFNQDWADEFDVPALACMNEENYNKWLKTPSGEINPNYEKLLEKKEALDKEWNDFWNLLKKKGYTLNGTANTSKIPKDDTDTLALEKSIRAKGHLILPNKVESKIRAYLGNSGECFEEGYTNLYLMEEFVQEGVVNVFEVNEDFYNTFKKANLDSLSLCNVFQIEN